MKFYRAHITEQAGVSLGYVWASSRRALRKMIADEGGTTDATIEEVYVGETKAAVLSALRMYASYPDNG